MAEYYLKTLPTFWEAIARGAKRFEIRKDACGFEVGDVLVLRAFELLAGAYVNAETSDAFQYKELRCRVTHILWSMSDVPPVLGIISIEPIGEEK